MMIDINNIFFSCKAKHTEEKIILNSINLSVEAGESILIAGNKGSGKSSLFSMLRGKIRPLLGTIKIDGKNISDFSDKELRNTVAFIDGNLQDFLVHDLTFVENLYLYTMQDNKISPFLHPNKARMLEIIDSIKELNLGINIDEIANTPVKELPTFYRHMLLIFIATLKKPKVILLDNVFSDIDIDDIKYVFPVLKSVCHSQKFTTLLSTENTYMINKICDRVVVFSNGSIVFDEKSGNNLDIQKVTELFNHHLSQALTESNTMQQKVTMQQVTQTYSTQQDMTQNLNIPKDMNIPH